MYLHCHNFTLPAAVTHLPRHRQLTTPAQPHCAVQSLLLMGAMATDPWHGWLDSTNPPTSPPKPAAYNPEKQYATV